MPEVKLFLFAILLAFETSAADIQVYFSPQGGCTKAITNELAKAKTNVLVQAYSFTSAPIAKALVDAKKRGVNVRVILDESQKSQQYSSADFVSRAGIGVMLLLVLVGCTTMQLQPAELALCGPRPADWQAQNAAQEYIRKVGLKDPGSAQVQDVRVVRPAKWFKGLINGGGYNYGYEIAFQYNAKNAFGGYVGFQNVTILLDSSGTVFWPIGTN